MPVFLFQVENLVKTLKKWTKIVKFFKKIKKIFKKWSKVVGSG